MPSYRTILTVTTLAPGRHPEVVEQAARAATRPANGARDAERAECARDAEAREEADSSAGAPIKLTRSPSSGNSRSKRESAIVLLYRFKGLRWVRGADLARGVKPHGFSMGFR